MARFNYIQHSLWIGILLGCAAQASSATSSTTSSTSGPTTGLTTGPTAEPATGHVTTIVSLKAGSGSSSNPLRLQEAQGSFYHFAEPKLAVVYPYSDRLIFFADAAAQARDYLDQAIGDNGRFLSAQGILATQYFYSDLVEFGGDFGIGHYEGRDFYYEATSIAGRTFQSSLLRPSLYTRFNFPKSFALASYSYGVLSFDGESQDEGGVRYKDDRTEGLAKIGGGFRPTTEAQLALYATRLDRRYSDRRARFTEGTPNTVLSRLTEEEIGLELEALYDFDLAKAKITAAVGRNRDLIREANDNELRRLTVASEVPLLDWLQIEASAALWERRFTNFVPAPLTDPDSQARRRDSAITLTASSTLRFDWFDTLIKYSRDDINSNYALADSKETILEVAVRKAF